MSYFNKFSDNKKILAENTLRNSHYIYRLKYRPTKGCLHFVFLIPSPGTKGCRFPLQRFKQGCLQAHQGYKIVSRPILGSKVCFPLYTRSKGLRLKHKGILVVYQSGNKVSLLCIHYNTLTVYQDQRLSPYSITRLQMCLSLLNQG